MTYLDNGATSFHKPPQVQQAVIRAMNRCANPGRGGYGAAMEAAKVVYRCRETASELFDCDPERVVFTSNCTHGLNIAIRTLVKPGDRVVISGFEHNAVTRPLHGLGARITVAGRKLFDWEDTLKEFETALKKGADAAAFTHVSNVFGYILPVEEMASLCRGYGVPFVVDAAQSAGAIPVSLKKLGADVRVRIADIDFRPPVFDFPDGQQRAGVQTAADGLFRRRAFAKVHARSRIARTDGGDGVLLFKQKAFFKSKRMFWIGNVVRLPKEVVIDDRILHLAADRFAHICAEERKIRMEITSLCILSPVVF